MDQTPCQKDFNDGSFDSKVDGQKIGRLVYLMIAARLNIGFVAGRLTQYMKNHTIRIWVAVENIFRYPQGIASL